MVMSHYLTQLAREVFVFALIGAPSSAGTHHAGQEKTPAALRAAGLVERLTAGGVAVTDRGDTTVRTFAVDRDQPKRRNLDAAVATAREVAGRVSAARRDGQVALVVGGDCTITLGVLAGVQAVEPDTGLAYFDGDLDLSTPESPTSSGILDAMGIAHLLGRTDTPLARLSPQFPALRSDQLALIGYNEVEPTESMLAIAKTAAASYADREVAANPTAVAASVRATLRAKALVVHFDVDAVESGDLPLANFPHYGTGVRWDAAITTLTGLFADPRLAAVVLTEVNPSYHEPSVTRYVEGIAAAISRSRSR